MSEAKYIPCACGQLNRIPLDKVTLGTAKCGACKQSISLRENVFDVTATQLQKIVQNSPVPVIVDFWAPWCGPCLGFAPTFKAQAEAGSAHAVYLKVDTEAQQAVSAQFGIRGIPTLIAFKNGREVARQSGAMPAQMFRQWLSPILS